MDKTSTKSLSHPFHRTLQVSPVLSVDSAKGAILWFGLVFITAVVGGLASASAPDFYKSLHLPAWAPPAAVFGQVWTVLYLLMAITAWSVWRHRRTLHGNNGLIPFSIALIPNAAWSWIFFHFHFGYWALIDIAFLWLLISLTIPEFWRVKPIFGLMMCPLWIWTTYAGILNVVLWQSNPLLLK